MKCKCPWLYHRLPLMWLELTKLLDPTNPVGVSDKLSDASFSDDLGLDGVVICECINRLEDDKGFIPEMEVEMDLASEVSKSPVPHMKIKALLWRNLGNVFDWPLLRTLHIQLYLLYWCSWQWYGYLSKHQNIICFHFNYTASVLRLID